MVRGGRVPALFRLRRRRGLAVSRCADRQAGDRGHPGQARVPCRAHGRHLSPGQRPGGAGHRLEGPGPAQRGRRLRQRDARIVAGADHRRRLDHALPRQGRHAGDFLSRLRGRAEHLPPDLQGHLDAGAARHHDRDSQLCAEDRDVRPARTGVRRGAVRHPACAGGRRDRSARRALVATQPPARRCAQRRARGADDRRGRAAAAAGRRRRGPRRRGRCAEGRRPRSSTSRR